MSFKRASAVFLPITSLYSCQGIGTMGKSAFEFVDFLKQTNTKMWQVFPIGPTGYGDSPYQTFSAFAGNYLWIDCEDLIKKRFLSKTECKVLQNLPQDDIDYGQIVPLKHQLLLKAFQKFNKNEHPKFEVFCNKNSFWLEEYAVFMALKHKYNGKSWDKWPAEFKRLNSHAIIPNIGKYHREITFHKFVQYIFFKQWYKLKKYANSNGVQLIGDIPIFVAFDSADAWSNPKIFSFDENHNPIKVAGVPPDAFTKDGQLWGNPLYNWEYLEKTNFEWWIDRIKHANTMFDAFRIDHFRGFEAAWAVKYNEKTAKNGKWEKALGTKLFTVINKKLGVLPIIAEDLGHITKEVNEMRDKFGFPGMKILQFAFYGDDTNPYLPKNIEKNSVVYTGTHDNQTTLGWYKTLDEHTKQKVSSFLQCEENNVVEKMLKTAWESKAVIAIATLQDFLNLGDEARLNTPGTASGNWKWRFKKNMLTNNVIEKIQNLNKNYNR